MLHHWPQANANATFSPEEGQHIHAPASILLG
jgi:hypothetical protein